MSKQINSVHNPLIKNILLLQEKPRERRAQNLIVMEGVREIKLAGLAGHGITTLLFCPEFFSHDLLRNLTAEAKLRCEIIEITPEVFNRLAYRKDNGGLIAIAQPRRLLLQDLVLVANPLILVIESVEKPGNLGAILRTADAAGVNAVIVCDPQTDLYNPNTIRASLGTLFTNQVVVAGTIETIRWLRNNQIKIFVASLEGNRLYHQVNFNIPSALVMGSEAAGLTGEWIDQADFLIRIPMFGKVDSLNVSTSAAILLFEAIRQRIPK
jgi:TrmH family RNA methyltransferase